ncbi:MAG: hypothetical protein Q7R34_05660, partial [Dehalococcoidia bacterium]|nr:hypothetical protein [Dehalococcoidia bacterium]
FPSIIGSLYHFSMKFDHIWVARTRKGGGSQSRKPDPTSEMGKDTLSAVSPVKIKLPGLTAQSALVWDRIRLRLHRLSRVGQVFPTCPAQRLPGQRVYIY